MIRCWCAESNASGLSMGRFGDRVARIRRAMLARTHRFAVTVATAPPAIAPQRERAATNGNRSASTLGDDIARIVGPAHLRVIDAFVAAVSDEASSSNAVFARSFGKPGGTAVVAARLQAFTLGLRFKGCTRFPPCDDGTPCCTTGPLGLSG